MNRVVKIYRNRNYVWPDHTRPPATGSDIQSIDVTNVRNAELLRGDQVARAFARFLEEGRHGVFAMHGDETVGHAWVTQPRGRRQIVNGYARLEPWDSLIHFCFVAPGFRGRGLYAEMLHEVTTWALDHGAKRVRVDTSAANQSSQHGIRRAGFEEVLPTTSVVLGRWLVGSRVRPPFREALG